MSVSGPLMTKHLSQLEILYCSVIDGWVEKDVNCTLPRPQPTVLQQIYFKTFPLKEYKEKFCRLVEKNRKELRCDHKESSAIGLSAIISIIKELDANIRKQNSSGLLVTFSLEDTRYMPLGVVGQYRENVASQKIKAFLENPMPERVAELDLAEMLDPGTPENNSLLARFVQTPHYNQYLTIILDNLSSSQCAKINWEEKLPNGATVFWHFIYEAFSASKRRFKLQQKLDRNFPANVEWAHKKEQMKPLLEAIRAEERLIDTIAGRLHKILNHFTPQQWAQFNVNSGAALEDEDADSREVITTLHLLTALSTFKSWRKNLIYILQCLNKKQWAEINIHDSPNNGFHQEGLLETAFMILDCHLMKEILRKLNAAQWVTLSDSYGADEVKSFQNWLELSGWAKVRKFYSLMYEMEKETGKSGGDQQISGETVNKLIIQADKAAAAGHSEVYEALFEFLQANGRKKEAADVAMRGAKYDHLFLQRITEQCTKENLMPTSILTEIAEPLGSLVFYIPSRGVSPKNSRYSLPDIKDSLACPQKKMTI